MLTLRNWPIRVKIVALVVLPLLAVGGLLALTVSKAFEDVRTGQDVRDFSRFILLTSDAVDALQRERMIGTASASGSTPPGGQATGLTAARTRVDTALAAWKPAARDLAPAARDETLAAHVEAVRQSTGNLIKLRTGLDRGVLAADAADKGFTALLDGLLTVSADIDPFASGPDVGARADALIALGTAKEALAREGSFVAGQLAAGRYQPGSYRRLIQLVGDQETRRQVFQEAAAHDEDQTYATVVSGARAGQALVLQEQLLKAGDTKDALPIDAGTWSSSVADRLDRIHAAERQLTDGLITASTGEASAARRTVVTTVLAALGVLLLTVALSLLIARSLVRPLRLMRTAALDTAQRELVDMVHRLQQGKPVTPNPEPIPVLSTDEVGQVAVAFNSVHGVATEMAMEQAASRKNANDTFLNIARRSQGLIHRQLQLIDEMERGTTEPRELAELYKIDHIATRMRRHAEDLIVLSGATPARGWSRPIPVRDVVRSAVAEVEDYTRISIRAIDDAAIVGPAFSDVVHLLAELLENATSFSPPTTWAYVTGQRVANGYVLEIDDAGLGMDEEQRTELNARLAGRQAFRGQADERLGLFVVGRLAHRHAIDVRLRRSPYGGTTATVLLPAAVLQAGAGLPAASVAPSRSPSGANLAPVSLVAMSAGPVADGTRATGAPERVPAQAIRAERPGWFGTVVAERSPSVGPPASPVPVSALQRPPEPPIPVATVLTRPVLPATLVGVVVPVEVTGSVATGTAPFPGSGTSPEEASSPRARAASDPGHGGRIHGHPDAAADEDTEVTASLPVLAADGVALADDGQRVPASEEPKPAARVIEAVTENGLPRRSRHRPSGATRPAVSVGQSRPPGELDLRLPEETRAMMASYQAGSEHGRQVAADEAVRGTVRGRPADLPTTTADDRGEDGS